MNFIKLYISITCIFISNGHAQPGFENKQKKFPAVLNAVKFREAKILKTLQENGLKKNQFRILLMASKQDAKLRLYAGELSGNKPMKLIQTFSICASSGSPGPKTMQGDEQVPEGFYHISRFNPLSQYHLALEVSYPNEADKARNKNQNPGGDIMIHGSCVTIGCLPMRDEGIEEIYLYAVKARNNGQIKIPVYLFPAWPDGASFTELLQKNKDNPSLISFWNNLARGYRLFESEKRPLQFSVTSTGAYAFSQMPD
jgi:murein L,D-transpeptidase YafK